MCMSQLTSLSRKTLQNSNILARITGGLGRASLRVGQSTQLNRQRLQNFIRRTPETPVSAELITKTTMLGTPSRRANCLA